MTLGSHQKTVGASQVHLTPRCIIDELGPFGHDCDAKLERRDAERIENPPARARRRSIPRATGVNHGLHHRRDQRRAR